MAPPPSHPTPDGPTVVGIGASAGGLGALKTFFQHVPEGSGLAFVVVVHLSPEHPSHLAELLQPSVKVPVQQVTETTPLQPDCVYVIPPGANLTAVDTHLRLSKLEERRRERAPIDHFFRTLARTHDGSSVGVILTGTGSDGTLGVRAIKEKTGLTVVQDPMEAEYDGMPQSAIATGLVDLVLPLAEIPGAILQFAGTEPRVPALDDDEEPDGDSRRQLHKVFAQLRARTGRDFSRYKRSTILRRITRRMQLRQVEELADYLDLLRAEPDEVRELADDLLINVTSFFRDPPVFEQLEQEVIPSLFEGKDPDDDIRVWSVGCATGEEAYSLAILLLEEAARHPDPPRLQIFASDLHEHSLERARDGFYPGDIAADVSAERLERFFEKQDGGYRVKKEVRELVVFAPHNLLGDPPFSRLDLVACRNVLIYLQRDVQQDVAELFHYALRADGWLVLGTSETVSSSELFRVADKAHCLYRKRNVPVPETRLPVFPLTHARLGWLGQRPERKAGAAPEPVAYGALHQRTVEEYAPPSLLISPDDRVVHLSENVGRWLAMPGGEPTTNVFRLVREEFRLELRSALHEARRAGAPVRTEPVEVADEEGRRVPVALDVRPARSPEGEGYTLVVFDPQTGAEPLAVRASQLDGGHVRGVQDRVDDARVSLQQAMVIVEASQEASDGDAETGDAVRRALGEVREALAHAAEGLRRPARNRTETDAELDLARQRLQAVIEEYETSQEEMKASNEELQSANEELRSTMEELETGKEELQSMNEELQTVNQENRHKVDELAQLSGDLQNLLASTDIATLFLDRDLRILRYTPRVGELFNVRPADRGRPLSDLTHQLGYSALADDARDVLDRLAPVEREVESEAGRWYLTRVLPYRSHEDKIEGVVLTFVDVTERHRAQHALRQSEARLQGALEIESVAVLFWSADFRLVQTNDAFLRMTGFSRGEALGKTWQELTPPEHHPASERAVAEMEATGTATPYEKEYYRADGSRWWGYFAARQIGDEAVEYVVDITERKRAEEALRESEARFRALVEGAAEYALLLLDAEGTITTWSAGAERVFGYTEAEAVGQPGALLFTEAERAAGVPEAEMAEAAATGRASDDRWQRRKDGSHFWASGVTAALRADDGGLRGFTKVLRDNTTRKAAEDALRTAEERLDLALSASGIGIHEFSVATGRHVLDARAQAHLGLDGEPSLDEWLAQIHPDDHDRVAAAAERALDPAGSGLFDQEYRVLDPAAEGGARWLSVRSQTVFEETPDGSRQPVRVVGTSQDVTARRLAEAALRQSEAQFRTLAETVPDAVFTAAADGTVDYVSRQHAVLTGADPDEVLGTVMWPGLVHPDDLEAAEAAWHAARAGEERFEARYRIQSGGGDYCWVIVRARPVFDEGGRLARWFGTLTDVDALARAEETLRQLNATLEDRVEARTREVREMAARLTTAEQAERARIAAVLHDDLQQQLVGLGMILSLLGPACDDADGLHARARHILDDAVNVARTLAGELSPTVLDSAHVEDLLAWLAAQKEDQHGMEVAVEVEEPCQIADRALRVVLYQALREALLNVVKHAGTQRATLRAWTENGLTTVQVEDEGAGFDVERQRVGAAGGFGLPHVRERVEQAGGRCTVDSAPGRGTCVTVAFPSGGAAGQQS